MHVHRFTMPPGKRCRLFQVATLAFLFGMSLQIPPAVATQNFFVTAEQHQNFALLGAKIASLGLPDTSLAGAINGAMAAALNDDLTAYESERLRATKAFDALDRGTRATILSFVEGLQVTTSQPNVLAMLPCGLSCPLGTAWILCPMECCGYCDRVGFPVMECCGITPVLQRSWGSIKILYQLEE